MTSERISAARVLRKPPGSRGQIAFTGTLSGPRDWWASIAELAGYTVKDWVNGDTVLLVKGATNAKRATNKERDASRLGITVVDEEHFCSLLGMPTDAEIKQARAAVEKGRDSKDFRAMFR